MSFGDSTLETILPHYLTNIDKHRLKDCLSQFFNPEHRQKEKNYNHFYLSKPPLYFMQGDLLNSIPVYDWITEDHSYSTGFAHVMLISNTCDVSPHNDRLLDKEAQFALIVPLKEYFSDLENEGYSGEQIASIYNHLKHQLYTNLFYLPPNPVDNREFIVFLDKIFWHPSEEFHKKLELINIERFLSLDHFGFYLFICKLSYHFCRVPEESQRTPQ